MMKSFALKIAMALFPLAALAAAGLASADELEFKATLSGDQEVVFDDQGVFIPGGTDSDAFGRVQADFNKALSRLRVNLKVENLTGSFLAAHFHCGRPGQNGPVVFGMVAPGDLMFDGKRIRGTLTNEDYAGADCVELIGRPVNNIASLAFAMRDGLIYANVHTDVFPLGEVRGQMLADDDRDDD